MGCDKYFQPETCIPGKQYFIKNSSNGSVKEFMSVKFVDYCPHPAEVIILINGKNQVIHRIYLLQKNGRD